MLIIKFSFFEKKITWFINDKYMMIISFLLTVAIGQIIKRIRNSNKKILLPNPKGGQIEKCIEPNAIYEIVDPSLEIMVKKMLDLPYASGPLVISPPVFILAYMVLQKPVQLFKLKGVKVLIENGREIVVNAVVGAVGGVMFILGPGQLMGGVVGLKALAILTTTVLSGTIMYNVLNKDINCDNLVSKLYMDPQTSSMERVVTKKVLGFAESPKERNFRVYIEGSENTELYIPENSLKHECYLDSETKSSEIENKALVKKMDGIPETKINSLVKRTCKKTYKPLKYRTKTLNDLKVEDSTENREKAAPYIKKYEARRQRIFEQRGQ